VRDGQALRSGEGGVGHPEMLPHPRFGSVSSAPVAPS